MTKTCPGCSAALPLTLFRRWRGDKIATHSVCNRCAPPRTLSQMTSKQRLNAMARGLPRATPTLVMQMNERERTQRYRVVAAKHKYKHHQTLRRQAWNAAITDAIRKELRWARKVNGTRCPINSGESFSPSFFSEYSTLLKRMVDILSLKPLIKGAPLKPTMEEANPLTYIPTHTRIHLLALYSQEKPITRRAPAILAWCK